MGVTAAGGAGGPAVDLAGAAAADPPCLPSVGTAVGAAAPPGVPGEVRTPAEGADARVAGTPDADVVGGAPPDVGAPEADVLGDAPPDAPDAGGVGDDPRVPWAPPVPDAPGAAGPVVVGPAACARAAGGWEARGAVGDEVPTGGTPAGAAGREPEPFDAADGDADGTRPAAPLAADAAVAARPDMTATESRGEDPAADAVDAAEAAATAATAAEVGATERRTRTVGSERVPCRWNIRRDSVRRTALASGRCAEKGSGWSVDAPTGGPANRDIGAALAAPSPVVGPPDASPAAPTSDGPVDGRGSVGPDAAAPPAADRRRLVASKPGPGAPSPPAADCRRSAAWTAGPDVALPPAADRRRSVASSAGPDAPVPPAADGPAEREAEVVAVAPEAAAGEVVAPRGVAVVPVPCDAGAPLGAPDAIAASPVPVARESVAGGLGIAGPSDEPRASGAGVVASWGDRRSSTAGAPAGTGTPLGGAATSVTGSAGGAPAGDRRIASVMVGVAAGRARAAGAPTAGRADAGVRRESAVAVARARRRSSRPEGAGRAAGVVGSVAAEGARSPVTADDARPGPPSFPGRAGGPARGAGVRMTRASDFIVIFPAARTSSETRTGMVVGARRVVLPPGR